MHMIVSLIILTIVWIGPFKSPALAEDTPAPRTFQGTIADKLLIHMTVQLSDVVSGTYSYDKIGKSIRLEGAKDKNAENIWVLKEFDASGNQTGVFTGDFFGRVFSGTWSNSDNSKSYPFFVVETTRRLAQDPQYRSPDQILALARKGNRDAQYRAAVLYRYGQGTLEYDMEKSVAWYRKAVEQGHSKAQFALGKLYLSGQGVRPDFDEAKRWILRSAESGNKAAKDWLDYETKYPFVRTNYVTQQNQRDVRYYANLVTVDLKEAEEALTKLDTPEAKAYLVYLYYTGRIKVETPREVANELLMKAFEDKVAAEQFRPGFPPVWRQVLTGFGEPSDVKHLLLNMRLLAEDVSVPCYVFFDNPREVLEAFGSIYGGTRDLSPGVCGESPVIEAVPDLHRYRQALDTEWGKNIIRDCNVGTVRGAYSRGEMMSELKLNLFPQIEGPLPFGAGDSQGDPKLAKLRKKVVDRIESFYFNEFLFTRERSEELAHYYARLLENSSDAWAELYRDCQGP